MASTKVWCSFNEFSFKWKYWTVEITTLQSHEMSNVMYMYVFNVLSVCVEVLRPIGPMCFILIFSCKVTSPRFHHATPLCPQIHYPCRYQSKICIRSGDKERNGNFRFKRHWATLRQPSSAFVIVPIGTVYGAFRSPHSDLSFGYFVGSCRFPIICLLFLLLAVEQRSRLV
jgi:hypothetical protein